MNTTINMINQAAKLIKQSRHTIALTGAGVSTESGIPDFRSKNGLWSRFDPVEYGTIGAFKKNPKKIWRMLGELIKLANVEPNSGHKAMATVESLGFLKGIITQNIDCLHQKAGSKNVIEFHGSIASFTCLECGNKSSLTTIQQQPIPPICSNCKALLKPDIVFFDEQIPTRALTRTQELIAVTDVLLVAGTSCKVAPAATIPSDVYGRGGKIIEINIDPALGGIAEIVLHGSFSKIMKELITAIERV